LIDIDWDEFKEFKLYSIRNDNFETLLDFLKSYYNMTNPYDIFDTLVDDEITKKMLLKREIVDAESLHNFMRKM